MQTDALADTIRMLKQLRAQLVHALTQPNITATRFNSIREQLRPLNEQLRQMGVTDLEIVPQLAPSYVVPTRAQRREKLRARKYPSYEQRIKARKNEQA